MVAVVKLVKPEMVIVLNVPIAAVRTVPKSAAKPSALDRSATLLGPVPDLSQLNTKEVGVNENPGLGVTTN